MTDVVGPGSTIGILGAGQLGRMLAMVGRRMGYRIAVFGGDDSSPTGQVADLTWSGAYDDESQLREFASACDVVTYEFENIPAHAAATIAELTPLRPGVNLLQAAQNRFAEKTALSGIGLPTAAFRMVSSAAELATARDDFGGAVIVKANTDGYDGKGQWSIDAETDVTALWSATGLEEAIVEQRMNFQFELSAIGGRFPNGQMEFFRPSLNHHANHILDVSAIGVPELTTEISDSATEMARAVLEHFGVIGVLCLELFLTADGQLVVNEIAPRPHNSGHLTIEAYNCSQFELQLRTVCGLPATPLKPKHPEAAMANLLGQHLPTEWNRQTLKKFATPDVNLHLYGKSGAQENRKMGHITAVGPGSEEIVRAARAGFSPGG